MKSFHIQYTPACDKCGSNEGMCTDQILCVSCRRPAFDRAHGVRTDGQYHAGPVNLDGLCVSDLQIAAAHPALNEAVRNYALAAIVAREEREAGRIDSAMRLERKMERIYSTLMPKVCRW